MNHAGIASGCITCHAVGASGIAFAGVTPRPQGAGHFRPRPIARPATARRLPLAATSPAASRPTTSRPPRRARCATPTPTSAKPGVMNHSGITTGCTTCHAAGASGIGVHRGDARSRRAAGHIPTTADCASCHKSTTRVRSGHGDEPRRDHQRLRHLPRLRTELHRGDGGEQAGQSHPDHCGLRELPRGRRTSPPSDRTRR